MMWAKWMTGVGAMFAMTGLSTGVAMAKTQAPAAHPTGHQLVALGDSIAYGYNLGPTNSEPSKYAFPYLMGQFTHQRVEDLAVPGATSSDLLSLLKTSDEADADVRVASTVTIDIGNNDLLALAGKDGLLAHPGPLNPAEQAQFAAAIYQFSQNLPAILTTVHHLNPRAHIVLYNLYDPFSAQAAPTLHALAEEMIGQENQIIGSVAAKEQLPVVDAYHLFDNHQEMFVRPGDVHPTILGQEVLAAGGDAVWLEEKFAHKLKHASSEDVSGR